MKNLIVLLLIWGACHPIVFAQNLSVGLRAGALATSYWKTTETDSGNRLLTRPQIGALIAYPMTERFTLQVELNYAPKGDAWYFDYENGSREEIRDVYNYLEIPVIAKYHVLNNPLHIYAIGGFYLAHALSNKYTENDKDYDIDFIKGDFGIQIGGGAAMPFGPGKAFAELRFTQGLKDLDAFQDETITKLKGIGLSLGWMMELK